MIVNITSKRWTELRILILNFRQHISSAIINCKPTNSEGKKTNKTDKQKVPLVVVSEMGVMYRLLNAFLSMDTCSFSIYSTRGGLLQESHVDLVSSTDIYTSSDLLEEEAWVSREVALTQTGCVGANFNFEQCAQQKYKIKIDHRGSSVGAKNSLKN